jgi:hypothetical protein
MITLKSLLIYVTRTIKGKNFWYNQLSCWPVYSACYSNWYLCVSVSLSLPPSLHAVESKVKTLYSSIKPGNLLPLTSLWPPDIQLQRVDARKLGEPRTAPIVRHAFCHVLGLSLWNLPYKADIFSQKALDRTLRGWLSLSFSFSDQ